MDRDYIIYRLIDHHNKLSASFHITKKNWVVLSIDEKNVLLLFKHFNCLRFFLNCVLKNLINVTDAAKMI